MFKKTAIIGIGEAVPCISEEYHKSRVLLETGDELLCMNGCMELCNDVWPGSVEVTKE
jgi:hypothetical protein